MKPEEEYHSKDKNNVQFELYCDTQGEMNLKVEKDYFVKLGAVLETLRLIGFEFIVPAWWMPHD